MIQTFSGEDSANFREFWQAFCTYVHSFRYLEEEVNLTALIEVLKERPKSLAQQHKNKPTCQYRQAVSRLYKKYGKDLQEQGYTLEAELRELAKNNNAL